MTQASARSERARRLAATIPQAAQALRFYADVVDLQEAVPDTLDFEMLADALPPFVMAVMRIAPEPLAAAARAVLAESHDRWKHLLHSYWRGERDVEPGRAFVAEAMLQPLAARLLQCHDTPVVAVLRDKAHGSARSFICGFCLTEYAAARLGCAACGETTFDTLPVFTSEAYPSARIDACDSCRTYLKTIDLTRDGSAFPDVDDIATLTLDLWAREQGYARLRPNLLRTSGA